MAGLLTLVQQPFIPSQVTLVDFMKNFPITAAGPCRTFTYFPFKTYFWYSTRISRYL